MGTVFTQTILFLASPFFRFRRAKLLLYSENRVLRRLGDSEFDDRLGWNSELMLRLGVEARARFPLLFH